MCRLQHPTRHLGAGSSTFTLLAKPGAAYQMQKNLSMLTCGALIGVWPLACSQAVLGGLLQLCNVFPQPAQDTFGIRDFGHISAACSFWHSCRNEGPGLKDASTPHCLSLCSLADAVVGLRQHQHMRSAPAVWMLWAEISTLLHPDRQGLGSLCMQAGEASGPGIRAGMEQASPEQWLANPGHLAISAWAAESASLCRDWAVASLASASSALQYKSSLDPMLQD